MSTNWAYELSSSDWSSDVCSSDLLDHALVAALNGAGASQAGLLELVAGQNGQVGREAEEIVGRILLVLAYRQLLTWHFGPADRPFCRLDSFTSRYCPLYREPVDPEIGRASCRESGCQSV